jgi:glycosyltransferase involved in cell wall biosynthesis
VPFLNPAGIAARVLEALGDERLSASLRDGARRFAEENLSLGEYLASYEALIAELACA